jgi:anti-sigma factor RsiW
MCECSEKLIAWMDGELTDGEAAAVQQHFESCPACQSCLASYRLASALFAEYCDAATASVVAPRARLKVPRWAFAAAAAAAAVALVLFVPKHGTMSPAPARENVAANQSTSRSLAPAPASPALAPIDPAAVGEVHSSAAPAAERRPGNLAVFPRRAKSEHVATSGLSARPVANVPVRSEGSPAGEPAIEIAFSSDSIFPAGAMPEGVSFVAEVTLAADGSAEQMRLQPRLVEFQERKVRP